MQRGHVGESWERRKEYLFRSLFHDVPSSLSPVPEENESFDTSPRVRPPTYGPDRPTRAYSPLPPLIIEREPNRHDEPEEYYIKLHRKMRRMYRKLFIEGQSYVSSNSSDNLTDPDIDRTETEQIISQNYRYTTFDQFSKDSDEGEGNDIHDIIHEIRKTSSSADDETDMESNDMTKSTESKRKSTDSEEEVMSKKSKTSEDTSIDDGDDDRSSQEYMPVIFTDFFGEELAETASVHEEFNGDNGLMKTDQNVTVIKHVKVLSPIPEEIQSSESSSSRRRNVINTDIVDEPALLENSEVSDFSTTERPEVEIMRSHRVYRSAGSLPHQVQEESPRELMLDVCLTGTQLEDLTLESSDAGFEYLRSSDCHGSDNYQNCRRIESSDSKHISTQTDSVKVKNVITQTDSGNVKHVITQTDSGNVKHVITQTDSGNVKHVITQTDSGNVKHVITQTDSGKVKHVSMQTVETNRHLLRDIFVGKPLLARLIYD